MLLPFLIYILTGIALALIEGDSMDQISKSNISITKIRTPFFIRLGSCHNPADSSKNVMINQVSATAVNQITSSTSAVPGFNIEYI